jgi:hypothetical protein
MGIDPGISLQAPTGATTEEGLIETQAGSLGIDQGITVTEIGTRESQRPALETHLRLRGGRTELGIDLTPESAMAHKGVGIQDTAKDQVVAKDPIAGVRMEIETEAAEISEEETGATEEPGIEEAAQGQRT